MDNEMKCSDHPDAPHGFDRNGSHMAGHYVCECYGRMPPASIQEELRSVPERSRTTLEAADRIDDLTAKLDQYRTEYFAALRERDEYRKCADDAAMAHKVERDELMEQLAALTKDAQRMEFIEAHAATNTLEWNRKSKWSYHRTLTSYEYQTFKTAREAIDAAIAEQRGAA